ncbi:MAG: hypothetical protein RLZZ176_2946, partial [Cyanobacteriota bacterium]
LFSTWLSGSIPYETSCLAALSPVKAGVINNCSKVPVSFSRTTVTAETNVLINVKSLS